MSPKGYGEKRPKIVTRKIASTYDFLNEGDTLTEAFILALEDEEKQEICHSLNRRTEFKVLRTTYKLFDEPKAPETPIKEEIESEEKEQNVDAPEGKPSEARPSKRIGREGAAKSEEDMKREEEKRREEEKMLEDMKPDDRRKYEEMKKMEEEKQKASGTLRSATETRRQTMDASKSKDEPIIIKKN